MDPCRVPNLKDPGQSKHDTADECWSAAVLDMVIRAKVGAAHKERAAAGRVRIIQPDRPIVGRGQRVISDE